MRIYQEPSSTVHLHVVLPHFSLPVVQALLDHVVLLSLLVDAADLLGGGGAGA